MTVLRSKRELRFVVRSAKTEEKPSRERAVKVKKLIRMIRHRDLIEDVFLVTKAGHSTVEIFVQFDEGDAIGAVSLVEHDTGCLLAIESGWDPNLSGHEIEFAVPSEEDDAPDDTTDFASQTKAQLRSMCKSRGIEVKSKTTKTQMIEVLTAQSVGDSE